MVKTLAPLSVQVHAVGTARTTPLIQPVPPPTLAAVPLINRRPATPPNFTLALIVCGSSFNTLVEFSVAATVPVDSPQYPVTAPAPPKAQRPAPTGSLSGL